MLPVIPETSRELHLNLCDQSWLGSSLSHTCLTALNTPCVHKACAYGDRRYTGGAHRHLTLSLAEWPRSAAGRSLSAARCILASPAFPTLTRPHLCSPNCFLKTSNFLLTTHASASATADPRADGGICHPLSLDELFLPHMVAVLIPGCLRIFRDTTSTDFT